MSHFQEVKTERDNLYPYLYQSHYCARPLVSHFHGSDRETQPLSLCVPVPLLCTSPVVSHFHEAGTQRDNPYPYLYQFHYCVPVLLSSISLRLGHRDNLYPYLYQSHYCVPVLLSSISMRLGYGGTTSIPTCASPIIVYHSCCLPFNNSNNNNSTFEVQNLVPRDYSKHMYTHAHIPVNPYSLPV